MRRKLRLALRDARVVRRVAGWLTIFFVVLTPVAGVTGLVYSLAFVNYLSLIALVAAFGSWWSAADAKLAVEEEEGEA